MSEKYRSVNNLSVSEVLYNFINHDALEGTGLDKKKFWKDFSRVVHKLSPKNKKLLNTRRKLQMDVDRWHINNKDKKYNLKKYEQFLKKIGYIKNIGSNFKIETKNNDLEISSIAGPQLVVPITNARYSLNAANARWVSLYDSLYGTDIIESEESASERYDPERGSEVIKFSKKFLDNYFEIKDSNWIKVNRIEIENSNLKLITYKDQFFLKEKNKFIGYRGDKKKPSAIILKNNNLHIEIIINPNAFSAKSDPAGIADIIIESAITTICDHEDSVAAVDAEDKVLGYRNWLGLMKGDLTTKFEKSGKKYIRKLNPNRNYYDKFGNKKKLHGRSLLLNRNVGHLMTNPAILLGDKSEIPEGIMDAFITTVCCLHDLKSKKIPEQAPFIS